MSKVALVFFEESTNSLLGLMFYTPKPKANIIEIVQAIYEEPLGGERGHSQYLLTKWDTMKIDRCKILSNVQIKQGFSQTSCKKWGNALLSGTYFELRFKGEFIALVDGYFGLATFNNGKHLFCEIVKYNHTNERTKKEVLSGGVGNYYAISKKGAKHHFGKKIKGFLPFFSSPAMIGGDLYLWILNIEKTHWLLGKYTPDKKIKLYDPKTARIIEGDIAQQAPYRGNYGEIIFMMYKRWNMNAEPFSFISNSTRRSR